MAKKIWDYGEKKTGLWLKVHICVQNIKEN